MPVIIIIIMVYSQHNDPSPHLVNIDPSQCRDFATGQPGTIDDHIRLFDIHHFYHANDEAVIAGLYNATLIVLLLLLLLLFLLLSAAIPMAYYPDL